MKTKYTYLLIISACKIKGNIYFSQMIFTSNSRSVRNLVLSGSQAVMRKSRPWLAHLGRRPRPLSQRSRTKCIHSFENSIIPLANWPLASPVIRRHTSLLYWKQSTSTLMNWCTTIWNYISKTKDKLIENIKYIMFLIMQIITSSILSYNKTYKHINM